MATGCYASEVRFEVEVSILARPEGRALLLWSALPSKALRGGSARVRYGCLTIHCQDWRASVVLSAACTSDAGNHSPGKVEGAEIHWSDETAVVNTDVRGRSYAPIGKTPVTFAVGGTRQKLSMIATITNQGKTRWMVIDEAFNSDKLIEFLKALIKDARRKVFLILDNLRVHHSKPVKKWAEEHKEKLSCSICPATAPS